jgi:hypothetical protein
LVEQRTENPRVGGSIPSLATLLFLPQRFTNQKNYGIHPFYNRFLQQTSAKRIEPKVQFHSSARAWINRF